MKYGYLLQKLSGSRKKEELTKIFSSINKEKGKQLLLELKLEKYLNIPNLKDIVLCDDIVGIWSQLEDLETYPFTKLEKENISKIKELLNYKEIDEYTLYQYGLYISTVVYDIKSKDKLELNEKYRNLAINNPKEINIKPLEIANILNKKPDYFIKEIIMDLEKQIIYKNIENTKEDIAKYILDNYK